MKKLFLVFLAAGTLAACNEGTDGGATSGDSATLTTPSTVDSITVTTPMDSTAVSPMVDTSTTGTGTTNSGSSGQGTTGAGTTAPADSVK